MPYVNLHAFNGEPTDECHRSSGRVAVEGITSDLGKVLNLSVSGARIETKAKLKVGDRLVLRVTNDEICMALDAEVIWTRRISFFRSEVGFTFVETDEPSRSALIRFCTMCRDRLTLAADRFGFGSEPDRG